MSEPTKASASEIPRRIQYPPLGYCPLAQTEIALLLRRCRQVHFDKEVMLARHLHAQLRNQGAKYRDVELSLELADRLDQINFLVKSVVVLLEEHFRRWSDETPDIDTSNHLWFTIFLYAESFYYFAHRVQEILGEERPRLRAVSGFSPSRPITVIRNHLIDHPYRHSPDFGGSKAVISRRAGPILQARSEGGKQAPGHLKDPGLLVNAADLKQRIGPVLTKALAAVGGPVR